MNVLVLLHSNAFLWALLSSLLGPVLALIIKEFNLSYTEGGGLFSASSAGFMGGSLVGGMLVDHLDKQRLLVTNLLILFLMFGGIALVPDYKMLLVMITAGGLAGGLLITMINGTIGYLYSEKRAAAINLLNVSFGLGAVFAPIYASSILIIGSGWRSVYAFATILIGMILLLSLLTVQPKKADIEKGNLTKMSYFLLLKEPQLVFYIMSVLLSSGIEWGFAYWCITYMTKVVGVSFPIATNTASLFSAGMLFGRLIMSRVLVSFSPLQVLKAITSGALVMIIFVTLKTSLTVVAPGVAVFGLFLSGISPTLIGLMMDRHPEQSGLVSGLLMLVSGFGGILASGVIGFTADTVGLTWGMRLIPVWLTVLLVLIIQHRHQVLVQARESENHL